MRHKRHSRPSRDNKCADVMSRSQLRLSPRSAFTDSLQQLLFSSHMTANISFRCSDFFLLQVLPGRSVVYSVKDWLLVQPMCSYIIYLKSTLISPSKPRQIFRSDFSFRVLLLTFRLPDFSSVFHVPCLSSFLVSLETAIRMSKSSLSLTRIKC